MKPAFAEIAVSWEIEYAPMCLGELLKRIAGHMERLTGDSSGLDLPSAMLTLAAKEHRALEAAAARRPSGIELEWEWGGKVYDQFLSHKITDAKDVVLGWYNALAAHGYSLPTCPPPDLRPICARSPVDLRLISAQVRRLPRSLLPRRRGEHTDVRRADGHPRGRRHHEPLHLVLVRPPPDLDLRPISA